jgi:hypothetical protein
LEPPASSAAAADEVTAADAPSRPTAFSRYGRAALLFFGLGAIAWVVATTGPRRVLASLLDAAPWMPFIVALDAFFFVSESLAHRAMMGAPARSIPRAVFVRTVLVSYALSVLVPLGRASVEVSRVAAYRKWVGAGRAAAASVSVHSVSILANALLCGASTIAAAKVVGLRHALTLALLGLTLAMLTLSVITALVMRRSRLGAWLGRRVPRLAEAGNDLDEALRSSPDALARAAIFCTLGRASQVVQSALLIAAVGGALHLSSALLGQGIHIVGSTFGEIVPAQTGVIEGAYRIFADSLGFASDPARAVAIALLGRISQMIVASSSLALLAAVPSLRAEGEALIEPTKPLHRLALPVGLFLLALAMNLGKAVHIDDTAHLEIARHIVADPTHPMRGTVFWGEHPEPIWALNQPPGLYYALALVMRWFGESAIVAQHAMMALFTALAIAAYLRLARRRLTPSWTAWTAVALFAGPAFLPSQNLMNDVPLLALWLVFFALLDEADERPGLHALAALVAGAACMIKYTSLVLLAVLALDVVRHHRRRWWLLALPAAVLVAWSAWNRLDFGGIHILGRSIAVGSSPSAIAAVGIVLARGALWVLTFGSIAPFVLAFTALPEPAMRGRRALVAVLFLGTTTALGQLAAHLVPVHLGGETIAHSFLRGLALGVGILGVRALTARVRALGTLDRSRALLVGWLVVCAAFIVVLSPFISVRHVLLALPPALLLLAESAPAIDTRARAVLAASSMLGVVVARADADQAAVYRDAAPKLAQSVREGAASATIWTVGHWGWQWYATRAGMREYDPDHSVLAIGDWLVRPRIVDQQPITAADRARLSLVRRVEVPPRSSLDVVRTVTERQGFYSVWGGLPWTLTTAPMDGFEIYRVVESAAPSRVDSASSLRMMSGGTR